MSTTALPLAIASSSSSLADHPADGALSNDSAQFWRPDPKAERRRASPAQIVLELLRPSPVHALLLGNAGAAQIDVYLSQRAAGRQLARRRRAAACRRRGLWRRRAPARGGSPADRVRVPAHGPRSRPPQSGRVVAGVDARDRRGARRRRRTRPGASARPGRKRQRSQPPPPVAAAAPAGPQCSHARPSRLATVKKGRTSAARFDLLAAAAGARRLRLRCLGGDRGRAERGGGGGGGGGARREAAEAAEAEQLAAEEAARKAEEEAAARRGGGGGGGGGGGVRGDRGGFVPCARRNAGGVGRRRFSRHRRRRRRRDGGTSAKRQRRLEFSANGEPPTPSDAVLQRRRRCRRRCRSRRRAS